MKPRLAIIAAVGTAALAVAPMPSLAATRGARAPVGFRGVLHRVAKGISDIAATDRFLYFSRSIAVRHPGASSNQAGFTRTLVDQTTGRRTVIAPPHCPAPLGGAIFGGSYLMVDCGAGGTPAPRVFDLTHHRWTQVEIDPMSAGGCQLITQTCSVVAVGDRWIAIRQTEIHGGVTYALEPLTGGSAVVDRQVRPGGKIAFDLDAHSGVRTLCAPLRYPSAYNEPEDPEPGWLQMFGRLELAEPAGPPGTRDAYLQRCGSRQRVTVNGPAAANTQLVVWLSLNTDQFQLSGAWLPSLRRFSIPLPFAFSAVGGPSNPQIALSRHTIYVQDSLGALWEARVAPRPPS